uniref:Uncharacterized protein n=1 Tax=Trichuris muris TaxID=70415 RepID=A0A5S6QCC0_TRIMR
MGKGALRQKSADVLERAGGAAGRQVVPWMPNEIRNFFQCRSRPPCDDAPIAPDRLIVKNNNTASKRGDSSSGKVWTAKSANMYRPRRSGNKGEPSLQRKLIREDRFKSTTNASLLSRVRTVYWARFIDFGKTRRLPKGYLPARSANSRPSIPKVENSEQRQWDNI